MGKFKQGLQKYHLTRSILLSINLNDESEQPKLPFIIGNKV